MFHRSIKTFGKIKKTCAKSDAAVQTTDTVKPGKRVNLTNGGDNVKSPGNSKLNCKTQGGVSKTVRNKSNRTCDVTAKFNSTGKSRSVDTVSKKENTMRSSNRRNNKAKVSCWNEAYIKGLNKQTAKTTSAHISRQNNLNVKSAAKIRPERRDGKHPGINQGQVAPPISAKSALEKLRSVKEAGTKTVDSGAPSDNNTNGQPLLMSKDSQDVNIRKAKPQATEQESMSLIAAPSVVDTVLQTTEQDSMTRNAAPSVVDAETQTCADRDILVVLLNKKIDEIWQSGDRLLAPVTAACMLVRYYITTDQSARKPNTLGGPGETVSLWRGFPPQSKIPTGEPFHLNTELQSTEQNSMPRSVAPPVVDAETQTCAAPESWCDLPKADNILQFLLNKKIDELWRVGEPLLAPVIAACMLVRYYVTTDQSSREPNTCGGPRRFLPKPKLPTGESFRLETGGNRHF